MMTIMMMMMVVMTVTMMMNHTRECCPHNAALSNCYGLSLASEECSKGTFNQQDDHIYLE